MRANMILISALGLGACGQKPNQNPVPPTNACMTEPNGDKIWYPDMSEFSPPAYVDGTKIQFGTWHAKCSHGEWVTDVDAVKVEQEYRKPLDDLLAAANSRLLTVEETKLLITYGPTILVRSGETYSEDDVNARFDRLLFLQKRFMWESGK